MNKTTKAILGGAAVVALIVVVTVSSLRSNYNRMVALDEAVNAAWAQVENQYQRRLDLVPNLVETVRGFAEQEREVFTQVAEARSRAGGVMQIDATMLEDPATFARFQQVQSELGTALQRLLAVQENYPQLRSNQNFLALQDQLEGTENRIAVARRRFNESARTYNTYIRQFPRVIVAGTIGFDQREYFQATAGADQAPEVDFGG